MKIPSNEYELVNNAVQYAIDEQDSLLFLKAKLVAYTLALIAIRDNEVTDNQQLAHNVLFLEKV